MMQSSSVIGARRLIQRAQSWSIISPLLLALVLLSVSLASPAEAIPINKETSEDYGAISGTKVTEVRAFDGAGNNIANPNIGSSGQLLTRLTTQNFSDGFSSMANQDWENPRIISLALCSEEQQKSDPQGRSVLGGWWGEFIRNDLQLTPHLNSQSGLDIEEEHIPIPTEDERMNPTGVDDAIIKYIRTEYSSESGTGSDNPRQYRNEVSAWLDGGSLYGSDQTTSEFLRSHVGGRMLMTDWIGVDYFPAYDSSGFLPTWDGNRNHANIVFAVGDSRNLDHIGTASIHLLLLREHNRLADAISKANPAWSDEDVYQRARKLVQGEIQAITYNEYLPSIGIVLPEYGGYDDTLNPAISNEFYLLVLNFMESLRVDGWVLTDENGTPYPESPLTLGAGYWSGEALLTYSIEPLLRGGSLTTQRTGVVLLADGFQNQMSGAMWGGWMDDCAMDIQRTRDRGLTDYNSLRGELGLTEWNNLTEISGSGDGGFSLSEVYSDVAAVDASIGVAVETRVNESVFGETQMLLAIDTFTRIRDGDRLWFANDPDVAAVSSELANTTLTDLILRNSGVESLSCESLFVVHDDFSDFDCHLANIEAESVDGGGHSLSSETIAMVALAGVVVLIAATSVVGKRDEDDDRDAQTRDTEEE